MDLTSNGPARGDRGSGRTTTVLDHAFRTLGEKPYFVIEMVTEKATSHLRSTSEHQVSPLQFSEWIHEVVNDSIQSAMETLRNVGNGAVEQLQQIAKELGRNDAPSQKDFEAFFGRCHALKWQLCQGLSMMGPGDSGDTKYCVPGLKSVCVKASVPSQRRSAPLWHGIFPMERPDCEEAGAADKFLRRRVSHADPSPPWTSDSAVNLDQLQADLSLAELASGEQRDSYGYS